MIQGVILFIFLLTPFFSQADSHHRLIFWYPGQVGTTQDAQPLMDAVGRYLSAKIPGTAWHVIYFPTESAGVAALKKSPSAFAVLSPLMRAKHGASAESLLTLLPLPYRAPHIPTLVVGGRCAAPIWPQPLRTREPFTPDWLKKIAPEMAALSPSWRLLPLTGLLPALRNIADGNCEWGMIEENECESFRRISPAAAASLRIISRTTYPAATLVAFPPHSSLSDALKQAMMEMPRDPESRELLRELRLAGFAEK